ncbi:hypothetical protein A2U01_0020001 [Trifolium medium]|uniref:Uncharacterized protein n=1 Tax=Trifolium medium TaxID=97028 RepID=A0A392NHQ7_9FABA|nr:hypothetical protein [Trifolium medium]
MLRHAHVMASKRGFASNNCVARHLGCAPRSTPFPKDQNHPQLRYAQPSPAPGAGQTSKFPCFSPVSCSTSYLFIHGFFSLFPEHIFSSELVLGFRTHLQLQNLSSTQNQSSASKPIFSFKSSLHSVV